MHALENQYSKMMLAHAQIK